MAKDVKTTKLKGWLHSSFFKEFKEFIDRGSVMDGERYDYADYGVDFGRGGFLDAGD